MSSYGTYTLRLRRERLEQLRREQEQRRKEQVCQKARRLLEGVRQALGRSDHHLMQHFGQAAQDEARRLAGQAERQLQSDPDRALQLARRSMAAGQRGLTEASAKVAAWSRQKAEAQEAVALLKLSLQGFFQDGCIEGEDPLLADAARHLAEAAAAMRREDFRAARAIAERGQQAVGEAEKARRTQQQREAVRREIVRGLRRVLLDMGFTLERPQLEKDRGGGRVTMVGRLPSGRTASFEIFLDGLVRYNFDGYEGRVCGKDEEAIRQGLETVCDAEATDPEVRWKKGPTLQIGRNERDIPDDTGKQRYR